MTKDIKPLEIKAVKEVVRKYLEVVQKALGIEETVGEEESEQELDSTLVPGAVVKNLSVKRWAAELAEKKRYLFDLRAENRARFAESQARFAEPRSKFLSRKRERSCYCQPQTTPSPN